MEYARRERQPERAVVERDRRAVEMPKQRCVRESRLGDLEAPQAFDLRGGELLLERLDRIPDTRSKVENARPRVCNQRCRHLRFLMRKVFRRLTGQAYVLRVETLILVRKLIEFRALHSCSPLRSREGGRYFGGVSRQCKPRETAEQSTIVAALLRHSRALCKGACGPQLRASCIEDDR